MSATPHGPADAPGTVGTVVVHVGAPKTGSTFLQEVLWHNRQTLAAAGVCYPLDDPHEHFAATMDLREMTWGGERDPAWDGAWDRVVARVRSSSGTTAVFSNELLGAASPEQIARVVSSFAPAEVHVVFTARDLVRALTSDWQEQVKHTHAVRFEDFVDDLVEHGLDATPPFGPMFWGLHDPVHVLRPWAAAVGPTRVHVVTVPPSGAPRDTLWRRFAGRLGIDPQLCSLDVAAGNPSLGAVEAELLRELNERADRHQPRRYLDDVRGRLIDQVLRSRPGRTPIAFPARHLDWAQQRSRQLIEGVQAAGYDVVGDLAELEPAPPTAGGIDPGSISDAERLEATLDALVGLITQPPTQA